MSFTKDSATTTNRISLANSTNWEMWHQDFKSKAVGYDMWNYVQGIKELAPNPERPTYASKEQLPPAYRKDNSYTICRH